MPLFNAAIRDKPTGSHDIDCRATKNSPRLVWRLEKYTPTRASVVRYASTMAASNAVKAVCMSGRQKSTTTRRYDGGGMTRIIDRALESRATVYAACAASLAL